eukprot:7380101-Prymnesium_polylepis.1
MAAPRPGGHHRLIAGLRVSPCSVVPSAADPSHALDARLLALLDELLVCRKRGELRGRRSADIQLIECTADMPLRPPLLISVLRVSNAAIIELRGSPLDARKRGAFCGAMRNGTRPSHVTVTRHATSIRSVRIGIVSRRTDTPHVDPRPVASPGESASPAQISDSPPSGHQSAASIPATHQPTCSAVTRQTSPTSGRSTTPHRCKPRASGAFASIRHFIPFSDSSGSSGSCTQPNGHHVGVGMASVGEHSPRRRSGRIKLAQRSTV